MGLALLGSPACGGGPKPPPPIIGFIITTTLLNFAVIDLPYETTLEVVNPVGDVTWTITDGALPPGLSLDAVTGVISGMTTDIGSFFFSIEVTDSSDPDPQVASADIGIASVAAEPGIAVLVSTSSLNVQANLGADLGKLSPNGRYIVFRSRSSNLAGFNSNGVADVFVRDNCRDQDLDICFLETIRASNTHDEINASDGENQPVGVTSSGRYAIFLSNATNLVLDDTNDAWDIFLRDTCEGEDIAVCTPSTIRISLAADGSEILGDSIEVSMSEDARFIAFRSLANNIVAGDTNGASDVFVRDTCLEQDPMLCTPTTVRASVDTAGAQATGNSLRPSLSPDGQFVAFESLATNLVAGDTNGLPDVFVRDTCLGAAIGCAPSTIRASVADDGSQTLTSSFQASASGGGRFIAFVSLAPDLVAGDTNSLSDVFVRDTCAGAPMGCTPGTVRVSIDENDAEFNATSTEPSIDGNGRVITFRATPAGLDISDPNGASEIYIRDQCTGEDPAVCTPATFLTSLASNGQRIDRDALKPHVSSDGTAVVFQSASTLLVGGDSNNATDIFFVNLLEFISPPVDSNPPPVTGCELLPPAQRKKCEDPVRDNPSKPK